MLHEARFVRRYVIKIPENAFSCYPVTDIARARKFYKGVPGLKNRCTKKTLAEPDSTLLTGDSDGRRGAEGGQDGGGVIGFSHDCNC